MSRPSKTKMPSRAEWIAGASYVLRNFATPIVFYIAFVERGARVAIGFAVFATLLQVIYHRVRNIRMSPFFLVASGFTVLFGTIDLFLTTPRYFRLEPAIENFLIGTAFFATLFTRVPIVVWFAQGLPERLKPEITEDSHHYLRKVTAAWVIYLYVKGAIYLYLAFAVNLGNLIVLRSLLGGGSIAAMFIGEWIYRKIKKPI